MMPLIWVWRFISGNYLDGLARDPSSWWTRKTRARRALWRWCLTVVPTGVVAAYAESPVVHVKLAVLLGVMAAQSVLQRRFTRRSPETTAKPVTEVTVTHRELTPEELDDSISELTNQEIPGVAQVIEMARPRPSRRRQA